MLDAFLNTRTRMPPHEAETTISSTSKRHKYPSVWLDLLPFDICTKIASFLPRQSINHDYDLQYLPDAISLAAASPIQEIAVAASKSHTVSIEHVNDANHTTKLIQLWTDILDQVHHVQLPIDVTNNHDVRRLLSLPTITKAVIPNYPCLLRALHTGRSVRSLELRLTIYCPENVERELSTDISQLLMECPIQKLSIVCLGCNSCPRRCFAVSTLQTMRQKSNTLRVLHLKCTSEQKEPFTRLPRIFPNLEEFRLEQVLSVNYFFFDQPGGLYLDEMVYEHLRNLKSVGMVNCGSIETFVPLGGKLTELSSVIPVSSKDVTNLANCPNLRILDVILGEGAEFFFPQNLCNLHEISLTWNPDHRPPLNEQYYAPSGNFLTGLLGRNKNVSVLRLKNAMIGSKTLEMILRTTAEKLRTLFVPIFHQDEDAVARFSRLAGLIMRHNRGLVDLGVCSGSFGRVAKLPVQLDHDSGTCDPRRCVFCELHRRIDGIVNVLRRRVMGFCDDGIRLLQFVLEY